jgi:hypothetical protein
MKTNLTLKSAILTALAACILLAAGQAEEQRVASISHSKLDRLLTEIKPQRNESPWREIHWLTDVTAARRQAVAQDKPLVIFTAADGSPLGRT